MTQDSQRRIAELEDQVVALTRQVEDLRCRHDRLRAVVDGTTDAVFVKDLQGRYLMVNPATCTFVGQSEEDMLGQDDTQWFSPETARGIMELDRRIMSSGQSMTDEEIGTAVGETRVYLSTKFPYRDEQGRVIGVIGIARDVTERKRLEQQHAARERHLRTILDSEPECVKTLAADGTLLEMNRAGLAMIEAESPQQVCGQCIYPLVNPEHRPALQALTERVFQGESGTLEFEIVGLKGHRRWLETHAAPLLGDGGQVASLLSVTRDITERMRTIAEQQASRERLAILSRQLIAAQESERRHLARELHDEIGQILTAINLNLQLVKSHAPEQVQPKVADGLQLVSHAIQQVRDLSLNLRPSMLDDFGLRATLEWFLERQRERSSCAFHLETRNDGVELSPDFRTACYRVVQEAVTNVQRHANARNVWVSLVKSTTGVKLSVRDDGRSFDVAAAEQRSARGASMGLLGMRERVELLGGKCAIQSAPDAGTMIQVEIPLASVADEEVNSEEQAA